MATRDALDRDLTDAEHIEVLDQLLWALWKADIRTAAALKEREAEFDRVVSKCFDRGITLANGKAAPLGDLDRQALRSAAYEQLDVA